jgi:hypothetical protein
VPEPLLELGDKRLADLGLFIVLLEVLALLGGGVPADGADVDHAVAELDEGAALDGDVEVGDVVEGEVGELLVLVFADPLDEAVGGEGLAELISGQAVLGEAEVEEGGDGRPRGLAELLLLLGEVGAADVADGALLAEGLEEGEDLGGGALVSKEGGVRTRAWSGVGGRAKGNGVMRSLGVPYQTSGSECAIDVEEADGVLERTLVQGAVGWLSCHCGGLGAGAF